MFFTCARPPGQTSFLCAFYDYCWISPDLCVCALCFFSCIVGQRKVLVLEEKLFLDPLYNHGLMYSWQLSTLLPPLCQTLYKVTHICCCCCLLISEWIVQSVCYTDARASPLNSCQICDGAGKPVYIVLNEKLFGRMATIGYHWDFCLECRLFLFDGQLSNWPRPITVPHLRLALTLLDTFHRKRFFPTFRHFERREFSKETGRDYIYTGSNIG